MTDEILDSDVSVGDVLQLEPGRALFVVGRAGVYALEAPDTYDGFVITDVDAQHDTQIRIYALREEALSRLAELP